MDELLTVEEVAAWLKVPNSWVYDHTSRRKIPFVKVGRLVRFPRPAIEAWLKEPEGTLGSFFNNRKGGDASEREKPGRRKVLNRRNVDRPQRGAAKSKKAVLRVFEGGKKNGAGDDE